MTTSTLRTLPYCLALTWALVPNAHAATDSGAVQREITQLEQVWNDAYGANDLPKYFSYYAANPLLVFYNKRTTLADYRKEWAEATRTEPLEAARISDLGSRDRGRPVGCYGGCELSTGSADASCRWQDDRRACVRD